MFDFLGMSSNYDNRKVDRYENGDLTISTARVTDSRYPFETAVAHPKYNNCAWVVVENYDTMEAAQAGHARWVQTMTAEELPKALKDVSGSGVAELLDSLDPDDWRTKPYNEE